MAGEATREPVTTRGPFGIGIVGAGGILKRQALAYLSMPDLARMVGVADIDQQRAVAAQRRFGLQVAAQDYRELLERADVDVVSICTRPDTHARIVEDALAAGKHVLCEKPITRTLAEADEVIEQSERHPGSQVCCLYQWRADPALRLAKELIDEGAVGRPLMADVVLRTWRSDAYYEHAAARESWKLDGGGVLIVMGIHQLDALIFLLGEPIEVAAQMDRFVQPSEGEDAFAGWIRFRSGAIATVRFAVFDQRDGFQIEILGQRAATRIRSDGRACVWNLESRDRNLQRELRARGRHRAPPRSRLEPGPRTIRVLERLYALGGRTWLPPERWWHRPFVHDYLQALGDGKTVPVPPREARRSLELTVALYQAAIEGRVVHLPLGADSSFYHGIEAGAFQPTPGERA